MTQTEAMVSKILPPDAASAPVQSGVIPANCTREEIKMLTLARLKSTLEKHSASYFTVDDFVAILDLLVAPYCPSPINLIDELYREGKIAIVPFSPADLYKIVGEPDVYRILRNSRRVLV